jgi:hypothetical protein
MAAAAASGRRATDLTLQDVAVITSAWLPLLPRTLGECNKLLSQRMRSVLAGDPVAYDLIKQDGKDFMWVYYLAPLQIAECINATAI